MGGLTKQIANLPHHEIKDFVMGTPKIYPTKFLTEIRRGPRSICFYVN